LSYCTWDIESTIKQSFKRKANPFDSDNWVVTHAFKKRGGAVEEYRFGEKRPAPGWLRPVLAGTRLLVGFNIKFDLLHALQDGDNLDAWMEYVAGGGNVWDCQLAEYLLCGMGQKDQMLSLDEVAPRYGGNVKVDEVKALWAAGVNTHEIDPELLSRYLCGGPDEHGVFQLGDVENTEKVALAQITRARQCGQLNSILLNMGSLLCTIEMERNGMFVNKAKGLELAAILKAKLDELKATLDTYLPAGLPFEFNWTNRYHLSPLIFGGDVRYDSREYVHADGSTTYCDVWDAEAHIAAAHHKPLVYVQKEVLAVTPICEGMNATQIETINKLTIHGTDGLILLDDAKAGGIPVVRYAGGKNAGEVKTKKVKVDDLTKPKARNCKQPYTFPRITEPKKEWASSTEGLYSVAAEVIEELGNRGIPFLAALSQVAGMAKDLGTYFITTDEETGEQKGLLTLVGLDGLVHHSINHTSTVTTRFSSSNPNLQNVPKGNKSDVKTLFESRFGEDGLVAQSDFTALEVYVQAILTLCSQLIDDLKAGLDMHCVRVSQKEGMPYDEVLVLCKGDKKAGTPPVPEWDYKRTKAKVFSFQRAYGAGAQKISDSTGMPLDEVEALIAAESERYPEVDKFYEELTKEIKANRKPGYASLPHPFVKGVMCNLGKSGIRTPDGQLYTYVEQPSPEYLCKRGIFQSFSPTEIKNYVVQGSGATWAKAAMWLAVRAFYARKNFGGLALLVNQVHDALYADLHKKVASEAAALLHACMEAASDFVEFWFQWTVPVPVPSDTTWGKSMMDEDPVPQVKELAAPLREQLRREYMGGFVPSFVQATQGA
jgi:DNA polymerase-1